MCALVMLQSVPNGTILSVGSVQGIGIFVEMHCGSDCNYEHYLTPLLPTADETQRAIFFLAHFGSSGIFLLNQNNQKQCKTTE